MSPQKKENYFLSFKKALLKPQGYIEEITSYSDLKQGLMLFLINVGLGFLIFVLLRALQERNVYLIFSSMSETLLSLPFYFILFVLAIFLWHIFAKVLGGKNSFKNLFKNCLFISYPIVLITIPLLQIFGLIWVLILLVLTFSKTCKFSKSKACFIVLLPFLMVVLLMIMTGLIDLNLLKFGL